MGLAKQEGIRWDGLVERAMRVAIKAGSITVDCPHETPIDQLNPEPAYELAEEMFQAGELPDFESLDELKQAMDNAFELAGEECASCRKNAED